MNAPVRIVTQVDPKLAWLARAAARFDLVQVGAMDLDEAFDGFVVDLRCNCDCECVARWERDYPPIKRRKTFR